MPFTEIFLVPIKILPTGMQGGKTTRNSCSTGLSIRGIVRSSSRNSATTSKNPMRGFDAKGWHWYKQHTREVNAPLNDFLIGKKVQRDKSL
jgi:hypothetical protein